MSALLSNDRAPAPFSGEETAPQKPVTSLPLSIDQEGKIPSYMSTHVAPPPKQFQQGGETVQLDYEQVELREIIEEIADALHMSVVIDPTIGGSKITLRTAPDKPLKEDDLWPLLRLLTEQSGIQMEKRNNVYYLKKVGEHPPQEIGPAQAFRNTTAPVITQITPLRFLSTSNAIEAIKGMVSNPSHITPLFSFNLIAITAPPEEISRINRILRLLDSDAFSYMGMRLFRLERAKAEEVSKDLEKIIKALEGEKSSYQVITLPRINALLLVSPPRRGFKEIGRWIEILDAGLGNAGEQVFIYKVRNLDATNLAGTLSKVFEIPEKEKEEPAIKPQPLTPETKGEKPDAAEAVKSPVADTITTESVSADVRVSIVADKDTNSLIVRATPRDYQHLLKTIHTLDRSPLEVMINVLIAEVSLSGVHSMGINWEYLFDSRAGFTLDNLTNLANGGLLSFTGGAVGLSHKGGDFAAILTALKRDTKVTVLSRPSLLVRNNQEATIKVGSEEPVVSQAKQSSVTASGTTYDFDVQYRDTGIILKVTPHINEDRIVNIDIDQEVSNVGETRSFGGTGASTEYPSFTTRHIKTSAVVKDGNAIILGGIMETQTDLEESGVPLIKDLPLLGPIFSNSEETQKHKELVLVIIPELIDPEADNSDYNNFFWNRMKELKSLFKNPGIGATLSNTLQTPVTTSPTTAGAPL